jgi:hypothetical protein
VLQTISGNLFWLSKGNVAVLNLGRKAVDYLVHYQRVQVSRINVNCVSTCQIIAKRKAGVSGLGTQGIQYHKSFPERMCFTSQSGS